MSASSIRTTTNPTPWRSANSTAACTATIASVDFVWIAVKLWDSDRAAETARPMLGPATTVVSFQNGVENGAVLRAALPGAHLLGGVAYISSVIGAPGIIVHTGTMAR